MINIRVMKETDLDSVAAIEKEIFSLPWSKNAFAQSLNIENTLYVVAEDNGEIKGYCGMYLSITEGNITNVAVSPAYRRHQAAYNMLSYILKLAKEKGITDAFLEVRETNVPAIRLYEKLGFQEAGIRKKFYEKPVENALIMWKHNL